MRYVKWGFFLTVAALIFSFLHYTLPQTDIVRVVGTENRRVDIGENSIFWSRSEVGMANSTSRDVFFINAVYENGRTMEYRNEDTGWGWPPYFKFNTSNLQALAADFTSRRTDETAQWVAIRHYGWRNEFLSIYPNAVALWEVEGPDTRIIPWFNIILLTALGALWWAIRVRWRRFWAKRRKPDTDEWAEGRL